MRRIARTATRRAAVLAAVVTAVAPAVTALAATPASAAPLSVTKVEGAAGNAAGLAPTVNAFRALLGGPDNGSAPGSQPGGRREINWDGVSDTSASPALLPPDFFNTTVPRGAVFANPNGDKFQVSADSSNPGNTPVEFANLGAGNAARFTSFSPERLFSPIGTTTTRIRFFEPGTNQPATVKGFGAVFTDVDRGGSSRVELYDQWNNRLWGKDVLTGTTAHGSLSFLGVRTNAAIYEVRIRSGNQALRAGAAETSWLDLVALDDFLYSEPRPLP